MIQWLANKWGAWRCSKSRHTMHWQSSGKTLAGHCTRGCGFAMEFSELSTHPRIHGKGNE